nr:polysaccharide biosynthesis C-terminal domain-containing protein [uncultured Arsenicibacter sp.]
MGIIIRQTIWSSVFAYAGIAVGFVTTGIIIPKVLETDQVGLLGLLPSIAVVLAQFVNLGLNGAGTRYFPYFRDAERQHNGYLLIVCLSTLIGFALCALGLFLARDWVIERYSKESKLFVDYYYLLIPLTLLTVFFSIFDNYARLLYDSVSGTFLQQFFQRLLVLGAIGLYYSGVVGFVGFMWVWLGAYFVQTALMITRVVQHHGLALNPAYVSVNPAMRKELIRYAGLTLMTALSSSIILAIDKVMVNDGQGLADTGIYSTMSYFGVAIALPATALSKVAYTIIAEAWKRNDLDHIADVYKRSCLNQLIIGCLVYMGVVANMPNLVQFMKPGYEAGFYVVVWIGLGKLVDMATGVNGIITATSRYYAVDSVLFLLLIGVTIGLNLILMPLYGINGVAIAAALATTLWNLARTVFVWAKFGMQPFTWHNLAVLVVAGGVFALAVWYPYGTGTNYIIADILVRSSFITILFGGLVYGLRLSSDVNQMVHGLLKKINFGRFR